MGGGEGDRGRNEIIYVQTVIAYCIAYAVFWVKTEMRFSTGKYSGSVSPPFVRTGKRGWACVRTLSGAFAFV